MTSSNKVSRRTVLGSIAAAAGGLSVFTSAAQARRLQHDLAQANRPPGGVEVREDVMVEMRDGTELAADVYLPDRPGQSEESEGQPGGPFPTLIVRTPYDKSIYGGPGSSSPATASPSSHRMSVGRARRRGTSIPTEARATRRPVTATIPSSGRPTSRGRTAAWVRSASRTWRRPSGPSPAPTKSSRRA